MAVVIHKSLEALGVEDEGLWIKSDNKAFEDQTPLEVMRDLGVIGIVKVAQYLDKYREH